ncbi:hypothetical protein, conserved [Trypanosoma brucei gambiense DAL972]|uniref:Uncharacterized protein n=2 Tax=Trypanosoma brucei TaxID=5691 RepID=C9ZS39_TRYB9|nr:hypothetical protein, conserved [Trypanosoma brucei gambiense DAL972]RHW71194.1 hypothetical protein DPX39_070026800 [Trypanosoma brucei equiperdum]CBH12175.1 hypothetical protein, conserved [Trypanosoma brucei gambiense DAL972]|eukprot:XP_011774458.1 hypothetical protein, conserved [Trypanosoma brucei gambiense DAL972]
MRPCAAGVALQLVVADPWQRCARRRTSTSANTKTCKSFTSRIPFKLRSDQVNESNIPSAREVSEMIATHEELQEQLPSAKFLESRYIKRPLHTESCGSCPATVCGPPLWPDCDTPEEIMDEERYGGPEAMDRVPAPSAEHMLLAWRALMWGTLYAFVGVTLVVAVAIYVSGVNGISSVLQHLRSRSERELHRLSAEGQEVHHFVLDLTNPVAFGRQLQEAWQLVQDIANKQEEGEESIAKEIKGEL